MFVKEVEVMTLYLSHIKGIKDADVPAEEGQAKERAWELFTG